MLNYPECLCKKNTDMFSTCNTIRIQLHLYPLFRVGKNQTTSSLELATVNRGKNY